MAKKRKVRRVTLTSIADQLSLSICTVSRILNSPTGRSKYADATVKRVLHAAADVGYQPNAIARSLVTGRTRTIGLCLSDIANPHFADFAAAFENRVAARGNQTFICNTAENTSQQLRVIHALLNRQVDSLVLSPTLDAELIGTLKQANAGRCNVIVFDRCVLGLNTHSVLTDNYDAMHALCDRCLSLGHQTIGVIAGDKRDPTLGERLHAICDVAASAGLSDKAIFLARETGHGSTSIDSGQRQMERLLALSPRPTLFLSLANLLTIGSIRAMKTRGFRAGREFSFAAFDDFPCSDLFDPAITVVAQPVRAMAEACADLACGEHHSAADSIVLASTLLWRESVTAPVHEGR